MTPYDPFSSTHVEAALYFTDQGQYLFKSKEKGGSISKTLREPEVCAAFTRKGFDSGWLGNGIVRTGSNSAGKWYVYLAERTVTTIRFEDQKEYKIPIPATLLIAVNKTYRLFALKIETLDQFNPKETVFEAPFPNVSLESGAICWGENSVPAFDPVHAANAWQSFFASPFNGDLSNQKSKKYPNDVRMLLQRLNKKKNYPVEDLVGTHYNVDQMVKQLVGRDLE